MSGLLPGFEWVQNSHNGGGTYDPDGENYPYRIVLHDIEGGLSRDSAGAHASPPHIWVNPESGLKLQTVPLDRSAFALWQGDYGYWLNKARALQCEITGYAAEAAGWSDDRLRWIGENVVAPLVRWVREQGSNINLDQVAVIGPIPGSASEFAPQRLSQEDWRNFNGLCSHRNCPTNDHWDCGGMDIFRVAAYAKAALGGDNSEEVELMAAKDDIIAAVLNGIVARLDRLEANLAKGAQGNRDYLFENFASWLGFREEGKNHWNAIAPKVGTLYQSLVGEYHDAYIGHLADAVAAKVPGGGSGGGLSREELVAAVREAIKGLFSEKDAA